MDGQKERHGHGSSGDRFAVSSALPEAWPGRRRGGGGRRRGRDDPRAVVPRATRRDRAGDRLGVCPPRPARRRRRGLRLGGQDAPHRERLRGARQVPGPQLAQDLPDLGDQPPVPGFPGAALRQVAALGRGAPAGAGGAAARAADVPGRPELRRGLRRAAERPPGDARRARRSTRSASGSRSGRAGVPKGTGTSRLTTRAAARRSSARKDRRSRTGPSRRSAARSPASPRATASSCACTSSRGSRWRRARGCSASIRRPCIGRKRTS